MNVTTTVQHVIFMIAYDSHATFFSLTSICAPCDLRLHAPKADLHNGTRDRDGGKSTVRHALTPTIASTDARIIRENDRCVFDG